MQTNTDPFPLRDLPRLLAEQGIATSYTTVWRRATDRAIPTSRIGWPLMVNRDDLPEIIAALRGPASIRTYPAGRAARTTRAKTAQIEGAAP